jgi:hypothetical protein
MNSGTHNQDQQMEREMVKYLLDEMSEEEEERFETDYFADDDLFERLQIVKAELADAYAHGQLDASQRERFERRFLNSPSRRKHVVFAQALKQKLSDPAVEVPAKAATRTWRPTWLGSWSPRVWALATASALLLLIGWGWLVSENRRLRDELAALRAERAEQARREQELLAELRAKPPNAVVSPTPTPAPPRVRSASAPALFLLLGARSAGKMEEVRLTPEASKLSVQLALDRDPTPRAYQAVLSSIAGVEIERRDGLRATQNRRPAMVKATFSAARLQAGEYTVTLSVADDKGGQEILGNCFFRVVR